MAISNWQMCLVYGAIKKKENKKCNYSERNVIKCF